MQFLYLARRDKSAVELIGTYKNNSTASSPSRIQSIHNLPLSDKNKFELINYYEQKKQLWEIFIENFANFADFRKKLFERRYKNIPANADPKLFNGKDEILKLDVKSQKIMLQSKIENDTM